MEASGPIHQEAHELLNTDLARIFDDPGPFVSLYLDVSAAQERARHRAELHWKNVRRELGDAGAPEAILELLDEEVLKGVGEGDTLAVIAGSGGVLHSGFQPDPPVRDVGRFGPLPYLAPLIEWRQSMPTHLVVTADRVGADIVAFVRDGRDIEVHLDGDDDVVHKSGKGGWSQRRYEQRTENTWEANAAAVAERLTKLVDRLNPRLVIGAGDVRALQLLMEDVPSRVADRFVTADGSRAADSSTDTLATDAVRLV